MLVELEFVLMLLGLGRNAKIVGAMARAKAYRYGKGLLKSGSLPSARAIGCCK